MGTSVGVGMKANNMKIGLSETNMGDVYTKIQLVKAATNDDPRLKVSPLVGPVQHCQRQISMYHNLPGISRERMNYVSGFTQEMLNARKRFVTWKMQDASLGRLVLCKTPVPNLADYAASAVDLLKRESFEKERVSD